MQHILQRLKESKKIKIKRENMQHILQPKKTIKKFTSMNRREKSNKGKNMSNIPCYKKKYYISDNDGNQGSGKGDENSGDRGTKQEGKSKDDNAVKPEESDAAWNNKKQTQQTGEKGGNSWEYGVDRKNNNNNWGKNIIDKIFQSNERSNETIREDETGESRGDTRGGREETADKKEVDHDKTNIHVLGKEGTKSGATVPITGHTGKQILGISDHARRSRGKQKNKSGGNIGKEKVRKDGSRDKNRRCGLDGTSGYHVDSGRHDIIRSRKVSIGHGNIWEPVEGGGARGGDGNHTANANKKQNEEPEGENQGGEKGVLHDGHRKSNGNHERAREGIPGEWRGKSHASAQGLLRMGDDTTDNKSERGKDDNTIYYANESHDRHDGGQAKGARKETHRERSGGTTKNGGQKRDKKKLGKRGKKGERQKRLKDDCTNTQEIETTKPNIWRGKETHDNRRNSKPNLISRATGVVTKRLKAIVDSIHISDCTFFRIVDNNARLMRESVDGNGEDKRQEDEVKVEKVEDNKRHQVEDNKRHRELKGGENREIKTGEDKRREEQDSLDNFFKGIREGEERIEEESKKEKKQARKKRHRERKKRLKNS